MENNSVYLLDSSELTLLIASKTLSRVSHLRMQRLSVVSITMATKTKIL